MMFACKALVMRVLWLCFAVSMPISSFQVQADTVLMPDFFNCDQEIQSFLAGQSSQVSWKLRYENNEHLVYASPTDLIGKWVQVEVPKNFSNNLIIKILESSSTKIYSVSRFCELELLNSFQKVIDPNNLGMSYFNDRDLEELISENEIGVVYVWSPSFVYSSKYLNETKSFVESLGVSFLSVSRGYNADIRLLERTYDKYYYLNDGDVLLNASLEIEMRGITLHSPSFLIYKDGKILEDIIVGVHTNESLFKQLKRVL